MWRWKPKILPWLDTVLVDAAPYPFPLERIEEALRDHVVMTVPAPAHRVLQIVHHEARLCTMRPDCAP